MKEVTVTLPDGHKAVNVRTERNLVIYEVAPEEKTVEVIEGFVARDRSTALYLYYADRLEKGDNVWFSPTLTNQVTLPNNLFPNVKWEDEKPLKVRIIIESV